MASKWTSTAGPIQTKRVDKALRELMRRANETVEISNMEHDGKITDYTMIVSHYGMVSQGLKGEPTKAETDIAFLYEQVGERFAWTITKANARDVLAAVLEADTRAQALRPVVDKRRTPEQYAEEARERAENVREHDAAKVIEDAKRAEWLAKAPKGATAAIVAEYERDDSHMQSDYSSTQRLGTYLIGWRFGPREDFAQLRAAAERFAAGPMPVVQCDGRCYGSHECAHGFSEPHEYVPTLDVATITEHRDNYSMGRGNYLSTHGWAGSGTGWMIRSRDLSYRNDLPVDAPDYTTPVGAEQPAAVSGDGFTITPSSTGKAGYVEVHFAAKPDESVRAELKRAGFRWALRSACWYGPQSQLPPTYATA